MIKKINRLIEKVRLKRKLKKNHSACSKECYIKDSQIGAFCYLGKGRFVSSYMGDYSYIASCNCENVLIGKFCSIGSNFMVISGNHPINFVSTSPHFVKESFSCVPKNIDLQRLEFNEHKYIEKKYFCKIGNDVWIGANVCVKEGVTIGDGAVIGMCSVVTKDVPPYTIVAGNPARIIRKRFDDEIWNKLENMQWWNMDIKDLSELCIYFDNPEKFIAINKNNG